MDVFSKYVWFVPLKDKKIITNTDVFQKILDYLDLIIEYFNQI